MRLTAEVLLSAPSYLNPVGDRELLLRGRRITAIENLGVTRDFNDVIDLTDNDIRILGNIPKLHRLKGLLLARNRITYIHPDIAEAVPQLEMLVLSANSIANPADIDALAGLTKLQHLVLLDNPVTTKENHRLYIIWRLTALRVLDFEKVRAAEREAASALFGTLEEPTKLATQIMGDKSKAQAAVSSSAPAPGAMALKLTEEDKEKLRASLKSATSLAEVDRIERALKTGYL